MDNLEREESLEIKATRVPLVQLGNEVFKDQVARLENKVVKGKLAH